MAGSPAAGRRRRAAAAAGMPGRSCHCPHWGYVISGKLRVHAAGGPHDILAGQAFHVEPGHAPETIEDTEMSEVSPTHESREPGAYLQALAMPPGEPAS